MDLCGPITPPTFGGNSYFVTFTDDKSKKTWVSLMKKKDETIGMFKDLVNELKTQKGIRIKAIRSDGGGEFVSKEFDEYLKKKGIVREKTPPDTPQRNGVAERLNRTLLDKARCMIFGKELDKRFWGEAVGTANFLKNRSPTKKLDMTPEEAYSGKKPKMKSIKVFGSRVQFTVNTKKKKLDERSRFGIHLGYDENNVCYRIWDIEKKRVTLSRDVKFYEEEEKNLCQQSPLRDEEIGERRDEFEELDEIQKEEIIEDRDEENKLIQIDSEDEQDEGKEIEDLTLVHHQEDERKSFPKYRIGDKVKMEFQIEKFTHRMYEGTITGINLQKEEYCVLFNDGEEHNNLKEDELELVKEVEIENVHLMNTNSFQEPTTYEEMLKSKVKDEWLLAVKKEMDCLSKMNTWNLVPRPKDKPVVKNRWVFKVKTNEKGEIDRYKARLVAKGYTQTKGIDYNETFAPVVRFETLRFLISYATTRKLAIHHMDVETAFLNGDIDEEIFMEQPEGFRTDNRVCRLNKSLYGLKQSPRLWNKKFIDTLKILGFVRSDADPSLFTKLVNNTLVIIAIYVDDTVIIGDLNEVLKMKKILSENFKMMDLKELKMIIGIQVDRNEQQTAIHQTKYLKDLLNRFGMSDCKSVDTPVVPDNKKIDYTNAKKFEDVTLYRQAIGSLNYLSNGTRPDISYAVSKIARAMQDPTEEDWINVKRIFRYLKGTANAKLIYTVDPKEMIGYSDASYAGDKEDRKSTSGYVFIMNGGAICWRSKKQPIISLSSMEAEYIALTSASKEGLWLSKLSNDLGNKGKNNVIIYEDNQSTIKTANNIINNERSKHIDVRYHFIREKIENKDITLEYCPTNNMTADILTKPLGKILNTRHSIGMGLDFNNSNYH